MNPVSFTSSFPVFMKLLLLPSFLNPLAGALISYLSSNDSAGMNVSSDFLFSLFSYFLADFSFSCSYIRISSISSNFLAISSSLAWKVNLLLIYFLDYESYLSPRSEFKSFLLEGMISSPFYFFSSLLKWKLEVKELPNLIMLRRISISLGFSTLIFLGISITDSFS